MQSDLETLQSNLHHSLIKLQKWGKQNGMLLKAEKTKIMLITTRKKRIRLHEELFNLTYNDINLQLTTGDKILGVNVDQNLQWTTHFQYVCKKISSYIWLLSKIHSYLTMEHSFIDLTSNHILIIAILYGEIHLIIMFHN